MYYKIEINPFAMYVLCNQYMLIYFSLQNKELCFKYFYSEMNELLIIEHFVPVVILFNPCKHKTLYTILDI